MRKVVLSIIFILILSMGLIAAGVSPHTEIPGAPGKSYNQYDLNCVVVGYDDGVVMEDSTGNLWAVSTNHQVFEVGSTVTLTMDSCGTQNITDDVIICVWQDGYCYYD